MAAVADLRLQPLVEPPIEPPLSRHLQKTKTFTIAYQILTKFENAVLQSTFYDKIINKAEFTESLHQCIGEILKAKKLPDSEAMPDTIKKKLIYLAPNIAAFALEEKKLSKKSKKQFVGLLRAAQTEVFKLIKKSCV